jgi:AraC-like DNA-binding protein
MLDSAVQSQYFQQTSLPVAAIAKEFQDGFWIKPHAHSRAQLVYATQGVMRVTAAGSTWVVPPGRAVWIPAGVKHEVRIAGQVTMRTLYIKSDAAPWLTTECRVMEVSRLLRELILSMLEESMNGMTECPEDCRGDLISRLILFELRNAPAVALRLPMPRDDKLSRICQFLLTHPASTDTIEYLSAQVGVSARTLARRFRAETGLSFIEWRQQVRLAEAVCRLVNGQPVKQIATEVGYLSVSAFIAMFHRALGYPPQSYSSNRIEA